MKLHTLGALTVGALLVGQAGRAAEQQADCGTCHQQPPVPAGHMPVSEVSVGSCFMCHQANPDDGLFVAIHEKHSSLDCSHCHGDAADDALRQKLDGMLGR